MNNSKKITQTLMAILIVGVLTIPLTLLNPSEGDSVYWIGVSKSRLSIFVVHVLGVLIIAFMTASGARLQYNSPIFKGFGRFVSNPSNYATQRYVLFGVAIFLSFAFIIFSILIPQALSAISGWLAFSAWMFYFLFIKLVQAPEGFVPVKTSTLFPSWIKLSSAQRRTALVLLALGLIYFCLFIPINLEDSGSLNELDLDEMVMYPVVVKMLSPQPTIKEALYQFINYGAYIYGFPFFGYSAALLMPGKLFFGQNYADQLQLNMLLLRQLVNVLPSIVACFMFTYMATHFKKFWASFLLFILLLTLPGMTGLNNTFWHPDGLNLLFIALTLFYLDRDQFRFGGNFYFAAITIGLSVATRLFGLFFFLAIAGLLGAGVVKKILSFRKTIATGTLFIFLMAGTIMVANPYLFSPGEPQAALNSFKNQSDVITQGWDKPDPEGIYRTGIEAWWPFMTRDYGSGITLIFLMASTIAGCLGKIRARFYRILLAWLFVIGTYLIGFVMIKSPWYLLPFLIPLYSGVMALPENLEIAMENIKPPTARLAKVGVLSLMAALGIVQIVLNLRILVPVLIAFK